MKRFIPRLPHRAGAIGGLMILLSSAFAVDASAASPVALTVKTSGDLAVVDLRTNALKDPLGVDSASPSLSWTVTSDGYNQKQTHYQIEAAGTSADLTAERNLVWDSGRVSGDHGLDIAYAGKTLASRQRVYWRVKVWNGSRASVWSAPGFWEMGLLSPSDWSARWIKRSPSPASTITNTFAQPVSARYVRLRVFETGPVPTSDPVNRLQLMELRVRNGSGANLAAGSTVTGKNPFLYGSQWGLGQLVDDNVNTGFTTDSYSSAQQSVTDPLWVQVDLGQQASGITSVELVNRTDQPAADSTTPNYPKRYQVQTSSDATTWTTAGYYLAGTGASGYESLGTPQAIDVPTFTSEASAPMFAAHFDVAAGKTLAQARLYLSGLGLTYAEVNGKPVADSYFDPSESDFRRRIFYSTYDVTSLVRSGGNGIGFMLGNGMYGNGVSANGGRYEKTDGLAYAADGLHGRAKGIAQLELTYTDGSTATVASGDSWKYTDSPITFNTWYGGEDYDARRAAQFADWSSATNTFAGWAPAQQVPSSEMPAGALRTRPTAPMRIVETLSGATVSSGQFASGDGWVDVSRNGAGFEGIRFAKTLTSTTDYAGVSLQFHPAEIKTSTDVDQSSSKAGSAPVFDTYTFSGRESSGSTWNPRFVYHGFRYYKLVLGLPTGRTSTDYGFTSKAAMLKDLMANKLAFVGNIVRTDNDVTGSFTSSNSSLNLIHTIIDRSIASQMYSTFTDCPHIEKLGWMETSHLMFPSLADTYDVRAWMGKISQDAVDSQVTGTADAVQKNGGSLGAPGYATAIAPASQIINGLSQDPNWNGAIILTPWEHYQAYGDAGVLRTSYPAMQKYLAWLRARYAANNYIVNDGQMGDWGQYGVNTPTPLVVTAAFYRMADAMAKTATILGHTAEATDYASIAATIKTNFNAAYFNPATSTYAGDTQASYAVPLFSGLVPDGYTGKALDRLVAVTEKLNYTITTGEIALRQMFSVLTHYGRSDVLYKMALQPAQPGYRYIAETLGETTMIEYWNYKDQWGGMRSRNHAMMGHLQDWFTRGLAGIDSAGPGYRDIIIKPYVPDNTAQAADSRTTSAAATIGSTYGTIGSSWKQNTSDGSLAMTVTIPVGTTATVYVPTLGYAKSSLHVSYGSVEDQAISGTTANSYIKVDDVPSGKYTFTMRKVTPPSVSATTDPPQPTGQNGWFTEAVNLAITASSASGIASREYRIDGGAWRSYTKVTALPVGAITVDYRATDEEGNVSAIETIKVKSDPYKPTVDAVTDDATATVTLTGNDNHSGVDRILYQVDDGAWQTYAKPIMVTGSGKHKVYYRDFDKAGNESATSSVKVKIG
jgi:alpha-L-rhamnosidase